MVIPQSAAITAVAQRTMGGAVGLIVSDFAEFRRTGSDGPGEGLEMVEGSLNGGGPVLQIVALGGSVWLRRQRQ